MDTIIKIAAIGIVGAVLAVTVKEYKKEFALFIGIGSGIVILGLLLPVQPDSKPFDMRWFK